MLAEGTDIGITAEGDTLPVQALRAGDRIYDLLSNTTRKILEVRARTAAFGPRGEDREDSILQPLQIDRGAVDGVRPLQNLRLSPAQEIFVDTTPGGPHAQLCLMTAASHLPGGRAHLVACERVNYYAIFTKDECSMLANGLLVTSYCAAMLSG